MSVRIDVWSDVVCPWCYIGKRRLEAALAQLPEPDYEVHWHSYQLDPGAPAQSELSQVDYLARKYGGGVAHAEAMIDRVEAVAAEEGLVYRLRTAQRGHTTDAHRLLHLAAESGWQTQLALKESLFRGYFCEGRNPADPGFLTEAAQAAGLDVARVSAVLASQEYADAVVADQEQAARLGCSGVPFFVFAGRVGVSGAQPAGVLTQAMAAARTEA